MANVIDILKKAGAITTDSHIVYTSGRHGSDYLNKDALYPHTEAVSQVGKMIAEKYRNSRVEVVIGPAIGGIILSQWTAYHLSKLKKKEILGGYSEKDEDNNQVFRRGYDRLVKGKQVLVVEDFTTTGASVRKTVDRVKASGGKVIGVCVMANRDPLRVTAEVVGAPFKALAVFPADSYPAGNCPLCRAKVPINQEISHGKKYLKELRKK